MTRALTFTGPEMRTIRAGLKTQHRVPLKPQPEPWRDFYAEGGCQQADWSFHAGWHPTIDGSTRFGLLMNCAFHENRVQWLPLAPGDVIVAKETWAVEKWLLFYKADEKPWRTNWRSPVTMPRWASRLTLTVDAVKIERVQDISEADARAEGARQSPGDPKLWTHGVAMRCDGYDTPVKPWFESAVSSFHAAWTARHGPGAWTRNDWVCATTFTAHHMNVDEYLRQKVAEND